MSSKILSVHFPQSCFFLSQESGKGPARSNAILSKGTVKVGVTVRFALWLG